MHNTLQPLSRHRAPQLAFLCDQYFDQKRPVSLLKRERVRIYALNDVSFSLQRANSAPTPAQRRGHPPHSSAFRMLTPSGVVTALGMDQGQTASPHAENGGAFGNRSELWWTTRCARLRVEKAVWDIPEAVNSENIEMPQSASGALDFWNAFARSCLWASG